MTHHNLDEFYKKVKYMVHFRHG